MKSNTVLTKEGLIHHCSRISQALCVLAVFFPLLALIGWQMGVPLITNIVPKLPAMPANMAIALIIADAAICLENKSERPKKWSIFLSLLIIAIGLATLYEYFFSVDLEIDQLFIRDYPYLWNTYPGRPSPQGSANLVLLGFSIIAYQSKRIPVQVAQICAVLVGLNSIISLTGYLFHADKFYGFPAFSHSVGLAVNSSFSFICLMLAHLFKQPEFGFIKILVSDTQSGAITRRIFWSIILLPPFLGIITRLGLEFGLYDISSQASLFVILFMFLLIGITWRIALNADKEELEARKTKEKIACYAERITKSEQKFRGLLENAQDAVIITDRFGKLIFVNKQVCEWFGYEENELLGRPVETLIPDRFREKHERERLQYTENPRPRRMAYGLEVMGKRKNGSEFPVDVALSPLDSPGEGLIITAVIRDISESKKQESRERYLLSLSQILSESLEFEETLQKTFRIIVPELADACVVRMVDEKSNFIPLTVVHRDPERQKILQHYVQVTTESPIIQEDLKDILELKKPISLIENKHLNIVNGKMDPSLDEAARAYGIIAYIIIPLVSRGKVIGTVSFILDYPGREYDNEDVSFLLTVADRVALSLENSRLYNEAQAAVKTREEVLAVVSHDLKNPVAAIKLRAQLLGKNRNLDDKKLQEISQGLQRSAAQMQGLINNLLDFSKMVSGTFTLTKKPEELNEIMKTVVEISKVQAEARGQLLHVECEENFPLLDCDSPRVSQVLLNLLGNAIKFTPEGGTINVTARYNSNNAIFSVSDNGPGIAEKDMDKVFEKFWQSDKAKNMGSGLGLSIAKGIIESHNGNIWVESKEGHGTVFFFTIPLFKPETASEPQQLH